MKALHPPMQIIRRSPRVSLGLVFLGLGALLAASGAAAASHARNQSSQPSMQPLGGAPEAILERIRLEEELIHSDRTATMLADWIAVREQRVLRR